MLRCYEAHISVADLELLSTGLVMDIWAESLRDDEDWPSVATQEDIDLLAS